MKALKIILGIVVVLAIGIWDVGLPHGHASPTTSPSTHAAKPTPSPSPDIPDVPSVAGVIHPATNPEFNAEFTGSSLDSSVWNTCYPQAQFRAGDGCTNFANQGEREWYQPSQVKVSGGALHLVAQHEPTAGFADNGAPKTYSCRSGMVTTYKNFSFKYGYVQVKAFVPEGSGLWSALWLAASNLQWPPEIDIIEAWGGSKIFSSAYLHFATPTGDKQIRGLITPPRLAFGWHTFGLSWTKTQMTWLLDGKVILTTHHHIPHQSMYFIADLAEYTTKAHPDVTAGQCNGSMLIRSVQVWKA